MPPTLACYSYKAATPFCAAEGFIHGVTPWAMRMHSNVATAAQFKVSWEFVHELRPEMLQSKQFTCSNKNHPFRFLWPCIVSKLWRERENQQDATIRCLLSTLSLHVSGIIMPTFTVLAPYNAAPHNRYQPHPAEPAQHNTCSNTRSLFSWRWA